MAFFYSCFGFFLRADAADKSTLNYRSFAKPDCCSIQSLKAIALWPEPVAFETETRPETFETKTCKNGSWDYSRDFITWREVKWI